MRSLQIDVDDEISNLADLHMGMLGGRWKWQDLQSLLWLDHHRSRDEVLGDNGDKSGSRVGVVWMEVGGGIVRARVVSRVVLGLVMKVVLMRQLRPLGDHVMTLVTQPTLPDEGIKNYALFLSKMTFSLNGNNWKDGLVFSKVDSSGFLEVPNNFLEVSRGLDFSIALVSSLLDDEISNLVDLHMGMLGGRWKWQDLQSLLWLDHHRSRDEVLGDNGDKSAFRVEVVWMEVGGGIMKARVVSRVLLGLVMKVVLMRQLR
ncbi:hypothetical protein Tco_0322486 [Tanacetum coccineum]